MSEVTLSEIERRLAVCEQAVKDLSDKITATDHIGAGFDHFGSRQKARFCLLHIRCEVIAFGHCGFSRGDV